MGGGTYDSTVKAPKAKKPKRTETKTYSKDKEGNREYALD